MGFQMISVHWAWKKIGCINTNGGCETLAVHRLARLRLGCKKNKMRKTKFKIEKKKKHKKTKRTCL